MDAPVPPRWESVRAGLLTAHLTRSGGSVYRSVRRFARMLEAVPGLEVDVFGPAHSGNDFSDWSPLSPRTASPVGPKAFSYAPRLVHRLTNADLDLVHLHGLWMHTSSASLGFTRRTGKPHMISAYGMLNRAAPRNFTWKRLAASLFENTNIRSAACLHALNQAEAQAMREYGFRGPICVIPNGVELPPEDQPVLPTPWFTKIDPEARTLLYLGRLHERKGIAYALFAWQRLNPEVRKGWRLVIAGWDERGHQGALRRLATALQIESTVTFSGPLFENDKKAAYQHCDGFILPSQHEDLPMMLLEAWAWGKPVLMTPQCNLPEGFEAEAALRIEADEEVIVAGLTKFFAMDDAERAAMGARGRALVQQRYAWPVVAGEMARVYRWLAGRDQKPASVAVP